MTMKTLTQKENHPDGELANPARQHITPEVDIFELQDGYVLTAEMPGVNKTGLEILLEGSELTIAGHKAVDSPGAELIFRESNPADYRRVFELDPSINTAKISAEIEQGVLKLHLPKAEHVKPRRIEVAG